MKKIGLILTYESGATVNRISSMINVLPIKNEIHVVGPIKNFDNYKNILDNKKIIFHNIKLKHYLNNNNFIFRYLNEFYYSFKCSKKLNSLNCDVEIISVPFISLILSSKLFQNKSMKILDIRDLVWEYFDRSILFQKVIFYFLKKIHLFFLKKYKFVTLTNKFEFNNVRKYLPNSKILEIPNGISKSKFLEIQSKINQSTKINKKKIIITYIGNVGLAQNLIAFINVIKDYDKYEFRIVGDGNDYENVLNFILINKIENVNLIGRINENEVIKYYTNTDILYASLESKYYTAIPSKLYEYLSTGKPIIYSGNGASIELLKKFKNIFILKKQMKNINELLLYFTKINNFKNSTFNTKLIKKNFIRETINQELLKLIYNE